ncbi:MAG: Paramecium bursaria Chlorella virus [Bacteroidota bacterium]|jgi:hypothetical protein
MKIICHRANLYGPSKDLENKPEQILDCIKLGFDVEIDVWNIDNEFYLGHDGPQYKVDYNFLKNKNLWCHAKNYEALKSMIHDNNINCFWHQNDDYTLTSKNFMWCYPNIRLINNAIAVMPETTDYSIEDLKKCYAICTDYPFRYKDILDEK